VLKNIPAGQIALRIVRPEAFDLTSVKSNKGEAKEKQHRGHFKSTLDRAIFLPQKSFPQKDGAEGRAKSRT
jgi:hypothetical protein